VVKRCREPGTPLLRRISLLRRLPLHQIAQLSQRPVLPREHRPQRLVQDIGDLPKAQPAEMTQVDDFPIRLPQLVQSSPQQRELHRIGLLDRNLPTRKAYKRLRLHRDRLPSAPTHLIPKAVHSDPKEPLLEPTDLGVACQLRRNGTERRLGDFLREFGVTTLREDQPEQTPGIRINDLAPCTLIPASRARQNMLDRIRLRWIRWYRQTSVRNRSLPHL